MEVLASSREEMALRDANVTILCNLVLEWIHRNWEPAQLNVDQLTAKVCPLLNLFFRLQRLYLTLPIVLLLLSSTIRTHTHTQTDPSVILELGQLATRLRRYRKWRRY